MKQGLDLKTNGITFSNLYCLFVRCCLIVCDRSRSYTKLGTGALGCFPVEGESRRRCHPGLQGSEPLRNQNVLSRYWRVRGDLESVLYSSKKEEKHVVSLH